MATTAAVRNESVPTAEYARLEERIIARDQEGASDVLYRLMKQAAPSPRSRARRCGSMRRTHTCPITNGSTTAS